jgi:hypothetical protein
LSYSPPWTIGKSGSATITINGGTGPFVASYSGQLPTGLSLTQSGNVLTLTGAPQQAGTFSIEITVQDSTGARASIGYGFAVHRPSPPPAPSAATGWHISFLFAGDIQIPLSVIGWDASTSSNVTLALEVAYNYFAQVAYPQYCTNYPPSSDPFQIRVSYVNASGQAFSEGTLWSNQTGP